MNRPPNAVLGAAVLVANPRLVAVLIAPVVALDRFDFDVAVGVVATSSRSVIPLALILGVLATAEGRL